MNCPECKGPEHPGQSCPPEGSRGIGSIWVFNRQIYCRESDGWKLLVCTDDELNHLRWQRDELQKRNSELARRNQALRMKELALEEIHRENNRLTERVVMLERVAEKLHDECGSEVLTEEECYVLEAIQPKREHE